MYASCMRKNVPSPKTHRGMVWQKPANEKQFPSILDLSHPFVTVRFTVFHTRRRSQRGLVRANTSEHLFPTIGRLLIFIKNRSHLLPNLLPGLVRYTPGRRTLRFWRIFSRACFTRFPIPHMPALLLMPNFSVINDPHMWKAEKRTEEILHLTSHFQCSHAMGLWWTVRKSKISASVLSRAVVHGGVCLQFAGTFYNMR